MAHESCDHWEQTSALVRIRDPVLLHSRTILPFSMTLFHALNSIKGGPVGFMHGKRIRQNHHNAFQGI